MANLGNWRLKVDWKPRMMFCFGMPCSTSSFAISNAVPLY